MKNESTSCGKLCFVLPILALVVAVGAYFIPQKLFSDSGNVSEEKIKEIVFDVARQNPQLLMEAMNEGLIKKREDVIKQLSADITTRIADIDKRCIKFGKEDAQKTIVCFFDPLCKHCIEFQKNMIKIIADKKEVCFKMIPVAVLGNSSTNVAKIYITVQRKAPAKMLKFIEKIVNLDDAVDRDSLEKVLKELDIDPKEIDKLQEDADRQLVENDAFAEDLKIPVVPAIFVSTGKEFSMLQSAGLEPLLEALGEQQTAVKDAPKAIEPEDKVTDENKTNQTETKSPTTEKTD
jgi:protein-disulfide isomerase